MAVDIGAALADLTEHAQKAQHRRRITVRPDTVITSDTLERVPETETGILADMTRGALPQSRFHAISGPRDGKEFVMLAGVKVGLMGIQLLNVVRQHPKGIGSRELWDAVGSVRVNGSQPGATSLRHLHRNGLVRKQGDRGWTVTYYPVRIRGID